MEVPSPFALSDIVSGLRTSGPIKSGDLFRFYDGLSQHCKRTDMNEEEAVLAQEALQRIVSHISIANALLLCIDALSEKSNQEAHPELSAEAITQMDQAIERFISTDNKKMILPYLRSLFGTIATEEVCEGACRIISRHRSGIFSSYEPNDFYELFAPFFKAQHSADCPPEDPSEKMQKMQLIICHTIEALGPENLINFQGVLQTSPLLMLALDSPFPEVCSKVLQIALGIEYGGVRSPLLTKAHGHPSPEVRKRAFTMGQSNTDSALEPPMPSMDIM